MKFNYKQNKNKMIKKLFAAVPIFATAFALRLKGDEGDSTVPGGSTLESLSDAGLQDAGEQEAYSYNSYQSTEAETEHVDMWLHVSEINGDPADDWYKVDMLV